MEVAEGGQWYVRSQLASIRLSGHRQMVLPDVFLRNSGKSNSFIGAALSFGSVTGYQG